MGLRENPKENTIDLDKAISFCKEELGLNGLEFFKSSPCLFFSYVNSKAKENDKNELSRYDIIEQQRLISMNRLIRK